MEQAFKILKIISIYCCMWEISMSKFAIVHILFEILATDKHLHLSFLLLKCIGMHIVLATEIGYPKHLLTIPTISADLSYHKNILTFFAHFINQYKYNLFGKL